MITKEEFKQLQKKRILLKKAAAMLSVEEKDLPRVLDRFLKEIGEMKSRI